MDVLDQLAVALGFATLAGLNLYLTVLVTGMAIHFNWVELATKYESLAILGEPPVLIAAGALFLLEFFADKIPWVDSLWDLLHTLIRPIGGGLLAIQTLGDTAPAFDVIIALLAGSATMVTHGFKAGTRLAINASPEPVSNIAASVAEDSAVVGASVLMWTSPELAIILFLAFLAFVTIITPRLFRRIKASLWLFSQKLRLPAAGNDKAPHEFPTKLTQHEHTLLSAELAGDLSSPATRHPTIEWAIPALSGLSRGFRGMVPNLFGKIVAEKSRPGLIYFIGRKNWRTIIHPIPLGDCQFSHEPRFLSEDLVIYSKLSKKKITVKFSRADGIVVDTLIETLEKLQASPDNQEAATDSPQTADQPENPDQVDHAVDPVSG